MNRSTVKTVALAVLGLSIPLAASQALAADGEWADRWRAKAQERIEAMDTDGDGAISREEYLANAEQQFERLDLDGDGYVTDEEREQIRAELRERREQRFP